MIHLRYATIVLSVAIVIHAISGCVVENTKTNAQVMKYKMDYSEWAHTNGLKIDFVGDSWRVSKLETLE